MAPPCGTPPTVGVIDPQPANDQTPPQMEAPEAAIGKKRALGSSSSWMPPPPLTRRSSSGSTQYPLLHDDGEPRVGAVIEVCWGVDIKKRAKKPKLACTAGQPAQPRSSVEHGTWWRGQITDVMYGVNDPVFHRVLYTDGTHPWERLDYRTWRHADVLGVKPPAELPAAHDEASTGAMPSLPSPASAQPGDRGASAAVAAMLEAINLPQYAPGFAAAGIDELACMRHMNEQQQRTMCAQVGITKPGHVLKLVLRLPRYLEGLCE